MKLTEKVRQKVIMDILHGKYSPGDKLPSERDMTELTQTSRITVRRAYDQLEKSGVIERNPKQATRIAMSFKGNQQEISEVGVIATLRDQFSRDFIESVHAACMENDALITLALADDSAEQMQMAIKLVSRGLRNIILWGYDRGLDFDTFERIRALGVNIVFFDRILPGPYADYVGLDNSHAVNCLIEDAVKHDITRFIYIDVANIVLDSNTERLQAFQRETKKRGYKNSIMSLPFMPEDKFEPLNLFHDFLIREGDLDSTAVICVNDIVALSIIGACPRNVPIYSIDGTRDALQAGIISYRQPIREMAVASVKALEKQQQKGDKWKAQKIRFKGELVRK